MSDVGEEIQQQLEAAIPAAFAAEGGFVTKWLLVAETMAPDGERGVWTRTSPDMKPWDSMGLLQFAMAVEVKGEHWGQPDDGEDAE